ncbi:hypothetical protein FHT44_003832 [Mycolicibacterium sp. BK634]|uniref:DUF7161 family protein n=1 Tax=Mycolicibacterium sp. BK634 TaxID=2587099 RepID=UPI00160F225F|nr:hypothetical protein [Mycolicibacterium sp. BK634]MBB3751337.1 hypothetical protein [Mycolicibacterium sp. BK634]
MERVPLPYDASGLAGKRAYVLVDEPTDEIDNPADLPSGTTTVVIVSDEPTPHHTLFVHPEGDPERLALVVYDQLSLIDD